MVDRNVCCYRYCGWGSIRVDHFINRRSGGNVRFRHWADGDRVVDTMELLCRTRRSEFVAVLSGMMDTYRVDPLGSPFVDRVIGPAQRNRCKFVRSFPRSQVRYRFLDSVCTGYRLQPVAVSTDRVRVGTFDVVVQSPSSGTVRFEPNARESTNRVRSRLALSGFVAPFDDRSKGS